MNFTTKTRRIQLIVTRKLGSREDTIWMAIITLCSCGAKDDLQHSLSARRVGFASLRHNHLRNTTANLIDQVCYDVRVEPPLQT